jgi:hypothetical protein
MNDYFNNKFDINVCYLKKMKRLKLLSFVEGNIRNFYYSFVPIIRLFSSQYFETLFN